MYKLIFFDTETTGNTDKDFLCQLAYKTENKTFNELFKTPIPIPPEASAIHHITNKMVADKPTFKDSDSYEEIKNLFENENNILVAHNAKFDIGMMAKEEITPKNFICTLRVARYLDKENKISQYKLQYLRYYLGIEIEAEAHDALGDVLVLEKLFERLFNKIKETPSAFGISPLVSNEEELQNQIIEKMIEISAKPTLMNLFNFGKHNGKTVAEVAQIDPGYLDWMLSQKEQNADNEEDWIYTLRYHLGKLQ